MTVSFVVGTARGGYSSQENFNARSHNTPRDESTRVSYITFYTNTYLHSVLVSRCYYLKMLLNVILRLLLNLPMYFCLCLCIISRGITRKVEFNSNIVPSASPHNPHSRSITRAFM